MAYIEVIQPEEAEGELKEIYEGLMTSRGKVAEVHKIQSLNPQSITRHMDLYMSLMFGKSPIKRVHREMMAVVVSVANNCEYCVVHHLEAVHNFWKDKKRTECLRDDFYECNLNAQELALCEYAVSLTISPDKSQEKDYVDKLHKEGFSDREILDATMIIAYFNFVNRIALGLGVEVEDHPGGYKY